jgi:hypothetical protein
LDLENIVTLTDLETHLRSGDIQNAAMESHLSKYRSLMPSPALIFHLLKRVANESDSPSIECETAQLSAAWCSDLQKHAEKLYRTAMLSEFDTAHEILKRISSGELEFTTLRLTVESSEYYFQPKNRQQNRLGWE